MEVQQGQGEGDGEAAQADLDRNQPRRSLHSRLPSFVKFINHTARFIDVVWLHFEGLQIRYRTLPPGEFLDVNTYQDHPWIFRDSASDSLMVVQGSTVFLPQPWTRKDGWPPNRRHVYITRPVFSLEERCFQVLEGCVAPSRADELEIPKLLISRLKERAQRLPPPQMPPSPGRNEEPDPHP